jgi:TP901 family phage tail tape measure protein
MPIQIPVVQTGLERSIQEAATKAGKNLRINMGPGAKSIDALSRPLGRLTGKADEFTKSMEAANARVLAFGASVGVIAAVSRGFQELVRTTIDVEKNLANINSILKQSESQLNSFKDTIFDIARNTGQTFGTVAEAALELSRQGLKAEEVTKRLNDALVLSRLSGLSAADSVSGLTAAINSFSSAGLTSEQVLNKISAAAASAAVSDRDLIEGLKRSGSVAVASGVQFDELIGIIGALQERTARGGAVIGNSLKTIFTRIQDIEKLSTLQGLGVQVTDLEGKVLSSSKVIENLGPIFGKLSQTAKVNLADDLVGKFQIAPFLALLEDYNQKVSRSGEIAATSFNATNEAYQRNEALSKTLAAAINTATVSLKELANTLGEIGVTENLSKIIGVFNSVVSSIQGILDGDGIGSKFAKGLIKGIGSIIAGPGLALALLAIGKLLLDFARFGAGALKTFFGLNAAAEAQKNLQGQIAASLLNDKGIRSAMLSIEKQNISEGEKKKLQTLFFTKALNEQLMLMQKMQGIAISIAPGVMAGTASARGGRRGRAAGGFLPIGAERSDISKGVGGSPSSAKPVVIPNFAFGGGRRGTMVANDSEYIVPNYANGGDAIFNQNMASSMGLPANARKVRAASGYIPNFANFTIGNRSFTTAQIPPRIADGTITQEQAAKAGYLSGKDKEALKNKNKTAKIVNVDAKRYGVASVFPAKKTADSKTSPTQLASDLAKAAAQQGITDIRFKGIQVRSLHDAGDNLKKKKNEFKNQIADLFVNPVAQLGANIIGASFQDNDKADLKAEVDKVKTKGAVDLFSSSVEGGIFESAIRLITKKTAAIKAFGQEKDDQMPFDFEEGAGRPSEEFQKTFKFKPYVSKADAKRTASNDAVRSVIAKAFNSKDQRVFLIEQIKKTNPNFKPTLKAAGGYIPNFAEGALENAIGREKGAGLPVSQIRINQSGKLRNSQNPMGLAVTNTRDEPTGAIPNFARNGVPSMGGMMTQTFQPTPAATVPPAAQRDLTGIFFALTAGMTGLQSATSDATSGIGKFGNMLSGSLQTVSAFAFAGSGIASAAQGATSGIGKFASKLGPASLAIGAVWGAFELGTNIIDEHSGANRRSADALARLKDSADQLALGFAHLTESQKYGIQKEAESIVNRRGPSENELGGLKSDYNADDIVQDGGVLRDLRDRKFGEDLIGDDKEIKQSFIDTAAAFRALGKNGEEIDDILDTYLSTLTGGEAVNFRDKYLEFKNSIDVVNTGFQKYLKTLDLEQLESLSKSSKRNFEEASFNKIPAALQDSFIKAAKGEASTAIDHKNEQFEQVSLTALKARVAAALELKKLQISLNTTAKDRLATAQALGNADLVALENLKANANKEQEKNEFAKNNLSFLQEYGEKLNNLGADADKLGAYEESISNKTVEQLTSAEFLKGVLAETLELKGIDKEQADLAVKNLQDQIDGSQKLYEQRLKNANVSENDLEIARKLLAIQSANTQSRIAQGLIQVESEENKSRSGNLVRDLEQSKRGATNASMREIDKKIASERLNEAQNQVITNNRDLSERVKQLMIQVKKVGAESDDGKGFLADVQKQSRLTKIANDELIANAEANKAAADAVGAIIPASILFKNLLDGLGQQRQDALAQAQFDVENLSNAGLTRQAAIRNDDSKFIKQYPNLPHELAIQVGSMNRGVSDRIAMGIPDALKSSDQLKQSLADASTGFAHNIGNAMVDAIAKGESLGDALLGTAAEFFNIISKAFMNKAVNDMMGTFFPTPPIKAASGGPISGGSGNKDDIPAMLMGGEFVMNKKSVKKYGMGFMSALNNGSLQGFASGGQVRDEEGMFTTPGMNGAGAISGGANLLSFATQTPVALNRDTITSSGAFLDAESGRMTMFGKRNNSEFQKVQDAKKQAFDLYAGELNARQQAKDQEKANKKALMKSLEGAVISAAVSAGVSSMASGYKAGSESAGGSWWNKFKGGTKGMLFGGNEIGGQSYGGLTNILSGTGFMTGPPKAIRAYDEGFSGSSGSTSKGGGLWGSISKGLSNIFSSTADPNQGYNPTNPVYGTPSGDPEGGDFDNLPNLAPREGTASVTTPLLPKLDTMTFHRRATGGLIPASGGVDTVPAMLSGGEFVMNAAATKNIGADNLQSLNSGSGSSDNSELVSKLDELIIATGASKSMGDINITINGSAGTESKEEGKDSSDRQRDLSEKIKTVVKQVIADEQRLGGQLRK